MKYEFYRFPFHTNSTDKGKTELDSLDRLSFLGREGWFIKAALPGKPVKMQSGETTTDILFLERPLKTNV